MIHKKLSDLQNEIKVTKAQYNKFSNFYYRSCEDIFEALKPLLKKYGLSCILQDDIVFIEGRFYVKATATLFDIETGESIQAYAYARESEEKKGMDSSQITGATSSYARKYALNGLFLLDDNKDTDSLDNSNHSSENQKEWLKEDSENFRKAKQAIASGNYTIEDIKKKYNLSKRVEDLLKQK